MCIDGKLASSVTGKIMIKIQFSKFKFHFIVVKQILVAAKGLSPQVLYVKREDGRAGEALKKYLLCTETLPSEWSEALNADRKEHQSQWKTAARTESAIRQDVATTSQGKTQCFLKP